jgi:hypothetical protein
MFKRTDVTFYDTYAYNGLPSIKLTNEEFYGGFSMDYLVDETLYYPKVEFVSMVRINGAWNTTKKELETEVCKLALNIEKYLKISH